MKLESFGILIDMRPFGERDCIGRIFTRDFGVMCGMLRGACVAKKNRPLVGQAGAVSWNARLDSQLGAFHWECARNLTASLMMYPRALGLINSAFSLIAALLPEREKYSELFERTLVMLGEISNNIDSADEIYLGWEVALLSALGYALDLSHCSNCGRIDNLGYLSSRTGRAVCAECAAPYMNSVYTLPLTLDITGKFLTSALHAMGSELPRARAVLI